MRLTFLCCKKYMGNNNTTKTEILMDPEFHKQEAEVMMSLHLVVAPGGPKAQSFRLHSPLGRSGPCRLHLRTASL